MNNGGTTKTFPVFKVTGPGNLYYVTNNTTKERISFDLLLQAGESLTIDLRPNKKTVVSSFRGSLINLVIEGSDFNSFHLEPGANAVAILIDDITATAAITWDERFWSVDGGG